jgi:lambda family phage tail tape measure protein
VPIKRVATLFFNLGRDIVKILVSISKKLLEFGSGFAKIFYDLATFLPRQIAKAFGTTPEKIFGKAIGTLKEGFKQYTSNFADYFPTFEPGAGLFGGGEGATPGLDTEGAANKKEKKTKKIIDLTNEQLQLGLDTVNLERQGLDIRAEYSKFLQRELDLQKRLERGQIGVNQAILEGAQSQQQLEQAIENAFKGYGKDVMKALDEEAEARAQINILISDAQFKTKVLNEEDQKRVQINQYLSQLIEKYAGILSSEELLEAIRKIREAMEGAAKATGSFGEKVAKSFAEVVKSSGDLANNLGATLGNAFNGLSDQLADFVTTGKLQFADFARSVLNDLTKIFIRAAMFQTLKALIPGGSGLAKAFGFASGGIMTQQGPLKLKRYAAGGIATGPQLAMYGEGSRPEAYVPLPDGRSIPVTMKGGGVGNVVVNVDANGSNVEGNGQQANALGKAIGIAVQQELIKQKRPGGLLA